MIPPPTCRWCFNDYPIYGVSGAQYHLLDQRTSQERRIDCEHNTMTTPECAHSPDCPCEDCEGEGWKG